jgi:hypothetical protein
MSAGSCQEKFPLLLKVNEKSIRFDVGIPKRQPVTLEWMCLIGIRYILLFDQKSE